MPSHVQRLCKLVMLATNAVQTWQNLPLASLLLLSPWHFTCPLMMLKWVTDIPNGICLKHQQFGVGQDAQRSTCSSRDVPLKPNTVGCFLGDVTQLSCMSMVTTLSCKFGVPGWAGMAVKNGSASPVAKATLHIWWSSVGHTPTGILIFLTTEQSRTSWALPPFQPREKASSNSCCGPFGNLKLPCHTCSCCPHSAGGSPVCSHLLSF